MHAVSENLKLLHWTPRYLCILISHSVVLCLTTQLHDNPSYTDLGLCPLAGKINAFVCFRNTNRKSIYTERPLKIRQKKNQVSGRGLTCEAKTRKHSKEDIKNSNMEKKKKLPKHESENSRWADV